MIAVDSALAQDQDAPIKKRNDDGKGTVLLNDLFTHGMEGRQESLLALLLRLESG